MLSEAALRAIGGGIMGTGAAVGQTIEEIFGTSLARGTAARDFANLFAIGPMFFGLGEPLLPSFSRLGVSERGVPFEQPVGRIPQASDFRKAAEALAGDLPVAVREEKLVQLWSREGIHPAEVVDQAARDPTVLNRLFSPTAESTAPTAARPTVNIPGVGVREELRYGLAPERRVNAGVDPASLPTKPLLYRPSTLEQAADQLKDVDDIKAKYPNAGDSVEHWTEATSHAFGNNDVPIPPFRLLKLLNSGEMAEYLKGLTSAQLKAVNDGITVTRDIRRAYINGEMTPEQTGELFLWAYLSKNASPFVHEGLFIDSFPKIGKWIKKAVEGDLSESDFDRYEESMRQVFSQEPGQPGAAAGSNLIDFGHKFLIGMARRREPGGETLLQELHSMIANPNMSGREIRRWFAKNTMGIGANNKVVSLALVAAGFDDVMVLDRVMVNNLFNDGRFLDDNLYSGCTSGCRTIGGSGLARLMDGPIGILHYELMERAIAERVQSIYDFLGRPDDASVARLHWEYWVRSSSREVAHETLKLILRKMEDRPGLTDGITAREGRYQTYKYGTRYGRDAADTPYMLYPSPSGQEFLFTLERYGQFMQRVRDFREGVVPKGFKVSEATDVPWYERSGVDKQRLDDIAREMGTPVRIRGGTQAIGEGR